MEFDHAQSFPGFAVRAWTSRDRVVVKRMATCLARERQNVFVETEELEKCTLSPIEIEGLIGVFAWSACDHEGRRRLVPVKRKKTTLVVIVKQYAMMRAKQDEEYQELHEAMEIHEREAMECLWP